MIGEILAIAMLFAAQNSPLLLGELRELNHRQFRPRGGRNGQWFGHGAMVPCHTQPINPATCRYGRRVVTERARAGGAAGMRRNALGRERPPGCEGTPAVGRERVLGRDPGDLFNRGDAGAHLAEAVLPQSEHALLASDGGDLGLGRMRDGEVLDLVAHHHHREEADAAAVASLVATGPASKTSEASG